MADMYIKPGKSHWAAASPKLIQNSDKLMFPEACTKAVLTL